MTGGDAGTVLITGLTSGTDALEVDGRTTRAGTR